MDIRSSFVTVYNYPSGLAETGSLDKTDPFAQPLFLLSEVNCETSQTTFAPQI